MKHRIWLVAALSVAAAGVVLSRAPWGAAVAQTPGATSVPRQVDARHVFGMQFVPKFNEGQRKGAWDGTRIRGMAMHTDLGVQVSREGFIWRHYAPEGPEPGKHLADFDDVVTRLDIAGIAMQAMVTETPMWASTATRPDAKDPVSYKYAPPRGLDAPIFSDGTDMPGPGKRLNPANTFAAALGSMIGRYPGKVRYWQIWNEPDYPDGVLTAGDTDRRRSWTGSVDQYVRLLKVGHVVVKWREPKALVVTGGLGHAKYLEAMLAKGAGDYFDLIDYHAYGWPGSDTALGEFVRVHDTLKAVLVKNGLEKGLICSETGYSVQQPTIQAEYIGKLYPTAIALGLETTMYYANINPSWRNMGLIDWRTMTQKTAGYWAYKASATALRDVKTVTAVSLPGVRGYRFERGARPPVVVLWAPNKTAAAPLTVTWPLTPGAWSMFDVQGRRLASLSGASAPLKLTASPVYLESDPQRAYTAPRPNPPLARPGLALTRTLADSSAEGQSGPEAAIDTDTDTQWVNAAPKDREAWLSLALAKPGTVARLRLKTGPTPPGTWFDVETSLDGKTFTPAATRQRVESWNMEEVSLNRPTRAGWVRLRWHNPEQRAAKFSVFEVEAHGAAAR